MTKDNKIHIPGRRLQKLQPGQQPIIRLTVEAYDTLIDLANESQWSIRKIASEIIVQSADRVVFDREEGD